MEAESNEYIVTFILSIFGLILFLISSIIIIIYIKKKVLLKSKPFIFILIHCFTNIIELKINEKESFHFKTLFFYVSYLIQFHLIISAINKMLIGKQIFKSDKDYSIKKLTFYEIIATIISFPYEIIFNKKAFICFLQNLFMIIILLCFYEYVKKKIEQVIIYINECNKDNIEIAYMEPEELNKIYMIGRYLWTISFITILLYYITKFFNILFRRFNNIHYIMSLGLISFKETLAFLLFIGIYFILFLLNKSYNKGQIIKEDDYENLNIKRGENKLEIVMEDVNIENKNLKNYDNTIDKTNNENFNKEKEKEKNEEEKLDDEAENLNINEIKKEEIELNNI